MFVIYKPIIRNFLLVTAVLAIMLAAVHYSLRGVEHFFGIDLSRFHTYFFWFFGFFFVVVILQLFFGILTNYNFKDGMPKISNGINNDVRYPLMDESDALVVKLSCLMDVGDMRNNRVEHARSYINSREAYTVNKKTNELGIICNSAYDYLVLSYDIDTKTKLINFVRGLLSSLPEENRPDVKSIFSDAISILDKFSAVTLTQLEKHHNTTIPFVAFNLQRAAMLVRWGLTCNMINDEEWNLFKKEIQDAYQLYFGDTGFGKFIYDYLIAVYLFHAENNLGLIRDRLYGITELQKNNFLSLSWEEINSLAPVANS
ncbi:hypothetical protein HC231_13675 [Brenneria izadpanahii]|uniref:DUF1266 domain-containing protein n=1 Tax=Brenneria izadpanahii TaxID=2722756 RepID=A0ABX7UZ50_9GAMM|nr:hypothetical protein [Brenneria izadpanahii]QTF08839.1 hypothetical protein HC231_13675 [Brenneria izadpanahii]